MEPTADRDYPRDTRAIVYFLKICCVRAFAGSATLQRGFWCRAGARRSQDNAQELLWRCTSVKGRQEATQRTMQAAVCFLLAGYYLINLMHTPIPPSRLARRWPQATGPAGQSPVGLW